MFYWGLSYENIMQMSDLNDIDGIKILDCMGAPSSFNSIGNAKGGNIISCHDVYGSSKEQLQHKMTDKLGQTIRSIEEHPERFVSSEVEGPKEYEKFLIKNMQTFFTDYKDNPEQESYSTDALPNLGFTNCHFDIAICRHFLFARDHVFNLDFHLQCVNEMCRVAKEVRIFPLLNSLGKQSELLPQLIEKLQNEQYDLEIRNVGYEFQRGGNAMLRVWHQQCPIKEG